MVELFDVTSAALEVAARGAERRQAVLAGNMANVNTPGFKRSDVNFEDSLAKALGSSTRTSSLVGAVESQTVSETSTTMRADGNNVDVDREAARLAETQILFDSVMAMESKRMRSLSTLIANAR